MIGLALMLAADKPSTFVGGNELYEQCISARADEKLLCLAYIIGATDGITVTERIANPVQPSMCISQSISRRQVTDTVIAYLRDHPAKRTFQLRS